jgi:hypothetical protein
MTKLSETQTAVLTAGAQRPGGIALPLPNGLAGAAAKMAVSRMITLDWLQEVEASMRRAELLWRETDDGHGTTLVVTDAGLLAIGIEPVVVKTSVASRGGASAQPDVKHPTLRTGTKQALLIAILQRPDGATMAEIIAATGWQAGSQRPGCDVGRAGQETRAGRGFGKRRCTGQGVSDRPSSLVFSDPACGADSWSC